MEKQIQQKLRRAMTVGELISRLEDMDPESRIVFRVEYGDGINTLQALPVREAEAIPSDALYTTAYSESGLAIRMDGDEYLGSDEAEEKGTIVMLSF